ncbi:MAG: hypothetical protein AB1439_02335 [candidate division FCPU426 bacterium]
MQTAIYPGRIEETWKWPEGLRLERTYYQPLDIPAVGIRFRVVHAHAKALAGTRIEARWRQPEIREYPDEQDDETWADPRDALLLLRDYILREESWAACGWGSPGGMISGGETGGLKSSDLSVTLESPAQDLPAGQAFVSTFWLTWGPDQESVAAQIRQLQRQSGYSRWKTELGNGLRRGLTFTCSEPDLVELFLLHKAWAPWMIRTLASGQPPLVNLGDNKALRPQQVLAGIETWLALHHPQAIRTFLDHWLDQRAETPDLAFTLCLAARYYELGRDRTWFANNAGRVEALADYLADMDDNGDGLPDYRLPPDVQNELLGPYAHQEPLAYRELEFFEYALAGCRAMHAAATFLNETKDPEQMAKAQRFERLAKQGADTLQAMFWKPALGSQGFYTFARVAGATTWIPLRSSATIELLRDEIGSSFSRKKIWQELWNNPQWRSQQERYFGLLAQSSWQNPRKPSENFYATHEILRQGLLRPETSEAAVERLKAYARNVVMDSRQLGWTGNAGGKACLDPASLDYVFLLYSGLAGLNPEPRGLRIAVPTYPQDLGVVLHSLPYRGALLDVEILGPGGGEAKVFVNGNQVVPGSFLPETELKKGRVKIKILRIRTD